MIPIFKFENFLPPIMSKIYPGIKKQDSKTQFVPRNRRFFHVIYFQSMCSKFLSLHVQLISSDRDIHPLEVGNSQAPNTYNSDAGIFLAMVSCTDQTGQTGHLVLTSS